MGSPRTLFLGIDEAGYGPRVGPLCVAMAAFSAPPESPPDWTTLRAGVCRTPRSGRDRRVQVHDSKKVLERGPGGVVRLDRLERSVLAFVSLLTDDWATDEQLLSALGAGISASPWYAGHSLRTPIDAAEQDVRLAANRLRDALHRADCAVAALQCRALFEPELNDGRRRTGSKARVSFGVIADYLRWAWNAAPDGRISACVDRQGGRTRYASLLTGLLPGATVGRLRRSRLVSAYRIIGSDRCMDVEFRVRSEVESLPTALASMIAKYAREISMARLNRYWSGRAPGLRPTAGYGVDAGRWLAEVGPLLSESERRLLVREA